MHLLLPSLLWPIGVKEIASQGIRAKYIEKLFSRANREVVCGNGFTETLFGLFGLEAQKEHDLPVGAVSLYGWGIDPGKDCWAVATPVNLQADRDNLLLTGPNLLDIDQGEAEQYIDRFNNHFKDDGFVLIQVSTTEWFLKLTKCPSILTSGLDSAIGRHIENYLPVGTDSRYWRSIINETEMLFFQSEVYQQMTSAGKTPINSLWISGFGRLPEVESDFSAVYSPISMAAGLAKLSNILSHETQVSINDLATLDGDVLVILTDLFNAELSYDIAEWMEVLLLIDSQIARLLKKHSIFNSEDIIIYPCCGYLLNINRYINVKRIWRKNKPLIQIY
jgi:hypothetical protein